MMSHRHAVYFGAMMFVLGMLAGMILGAALHERFGDNYGRVSYDR